MRLFALSELRLLNGCAFQAGRQLGWGASQQLVVAARRCRTYLSIAELQRLQQALALSGAGGEADDVAHAIRTLRQEFSATTPQEVSALGR